MNRTITLNAIEPAPLSMRHPLGINLDLNVTMRDQSGDPIDLATSYPQFVLLPRSRGGVYPYDMTVLTNTVGIASVSVPGTSLVDERGYNIELYSRHDNVVPGDPSIPTGLVARGTLITEGSAYMTEGPLNLINIPVVVGPAGPIGPMGAPGPVGSTGSRGSVWFTGSGFPTDPGGLLVGDMYLDESNGDVYRFNGSMWTRGSF